MSLPPQQRMTQKIMKMIQGDYIEKPDFALKSIGERLRPPALSAGPPRLGSSPGVVRPRLGTAFRASLVPSWFSCWTSTFSSAARSRGARSPAARTARPQPWGCHAASAGQGRGVGQAHRNAPTWANRGQDSGLQGQRSREQGQRGPRGQSDRRVETCDGEVS